MWEDQGRKLQRWARSNLQHERLRRWWCKKYNLPPTDPRYLAYTREQLFVEFLEDKYEADPAASFEETDAHVQFVTGDPVIDQLERDLAEGKEIDLDKAFSLPPQPAAEQPPEPEEFDDDYTAEPAPRSRGARAFRGPPKVTF